MTLFNDYTLVLPSIRAQSTLTYGIIGTSTHLRCSATAPFDTSLYWRRIDNNNISSQSPRFRQQQHIHGELLHTTLYIKDLEKADFGLYACHAESKGGRSKATIELKEHHHSTTPTTTTTIHTSTIYQILDKNEIILTTTSRTQLLKRNKISDQATIVIKTNHASSSSLSFLSFYLLILIISFLYL
ncbi:unnamed protein product [Adineta steineri]|uniref:Ig-like domain-containing protein n=1 Tax=Adineta steineri TaxID=433720 RepID=A0A813XQA0_9BILA|nr:unnamed protein product [Adineta steineri]CAF3590126.1 unnamed protein product [Adineta steineri]